MDSRRTGGRGDALIALALALVLGTAWAVRDWAALTVLDLPDTDDVMRLQQVRDWLAGQPWADLTQHRLAAGLPMHWTRLADLGPAALIALLAPFAGRHMAEVMAVTAWPLMLFAVALFLVARIARQAGGAPIARTAAMVAAIGFPATTVFLPGRIDHHGLQMVLLLGAVLATLRPATLASGGAVGMLAAASLVVGLETVPVLAVVGGIAIVGWVLAEKGAASRLAGLGMGALAGLLIARGVFAPAAWTYPACDGLTKLAWQAAAAVALVPIVLAAFDRTVTGPLSRGGVASAVAVAGLVAALALSPQCLHPYGAVDPVLAVAWLNQVGEAQPLLAAPIGTAVGYAGLMIAGIIASIWQLADTRERGWAVLLALQLAALATTLAQVRGAYAGALLAAPALAALIARARAGGIMRLLTAWTASAGMFYPLAADALAPTAAGSDLGGGSCRSSALLAQLAALPPGTVAAPIDLSVAILAGTPHRVIAAPYHRNNAGNLAALALLGSPPVQARAIAERWSITYVVLCRKGRAAASLAPESLEARVHAGDIPAWLRPIPTRDALLFAVERALPAPPSRN